MHRNKSTTKVTLIFIFLIVLIVGYYAYLSGRTRTQQADSEMSVVQSTLSRNLQNDYPATPKEVIKYYNEIMKCFYNEECTEEEIAQLGRKSRELFDEELQENNEEDAYLIRLYAEVKDFKDHNRRIASISLASSTNVDYYTQDGYSFARIMCGYNIVENGKSNPSAQVYLLRRDDSRKWKIYGWESADKVNEQIAAQTDS